jgi:hypothetical protein
MMATLLQEEEVCMMCDFCEYCARAKKNLTENDSDWSEQQ